MRNYLSFHIYEKFWFFLGRIVLRNFVNLVSTSTIMTIIISSSTVSMSSSTTKVTTISTSMRIIFSWFSLIMCCYNNCLREWSRHIGMASWFFINKVLLCSATSRNVIKSKLNPFSLYFCSKNTFEAWKAEKVLS